MSSTVWTDQDEAELIKARRNKQKISHLLARKQEAIHSYIRRTAPPPSPPPPPPSPWSPFWRQIGAFFRSMGA